MLNQALFDEIADRLVEQGVRVTYDSVNVALKDRDRAAGGPGRGKSDRDLQAPYADWKRRRRYRPYLSQLDISEDMEKAIAAFVDRAMLAAARKAGRNETEAGLKPVIEPVVETDLAGQLTELVASMRAQVASLAEENRMLRERAAPSSDESERPARPSLKREDRRRGLAAAAGRFFWDKMMQVFVEAIRERGPMTAAQLLETLDEDALAMAAAAFEPVSAALIKEKVDFRVLKKNYFRVTDDGLYDVLPKHAARGRKDDNG